MNAGIVSGIVVFILVIFVLLVRKAARPSRASVHQAFYARRRLGESIFLAHEVARMTDDEVVDKLARLEWIERQPIDVKARILSQVNCE